MTLSDSLIISSVVAIVVYSIAGNIEARRYIHSHGETHDAAISNDDNIRRNTERTMK